MMPTPSQDEHFIASLNNVKPTRSNASNSQIFLIQYPSDLHFWSKYNNAINLNDPSMKELDFSFKTPIFCSSCISILKNHFASTTGSQKTQFLGSTPPACGDSAIGVDRRRTITALLIQNPGIGRGRT